MEWYVYYNNWNSRKIEPYNVFWHASFMREVRGLFREPLAKEVFADQLRKITMYYFWSKCEWEVVIIPWSAHTEETKIKIDVYDQLKLNWDKFVDYVWSLKEAVKSE